jgi:hypothetical protein
MTMMMMSAKEVFLKGVVVLDQGERPRDRETEHALIRSSILVFTQ